MGIFITSSHGCFGSTHVSNCMTTGSIESPATDVPSWYAILHKMLLVGAKLVREYPCAILVLLHRVPLKIALIICFVLTVYILSGESAQFYNPREYYKRYANPRQNILARLILHVFVQSVKCNTVAVDISGHRSHPLIKSVVQKSKWNPLMPEHCVCVCVCVCV